MTDEEKAKELRACLSRAQDLAEELKANGWRVYISRNVFFESVLTSSGPLGAQLYGRLVATISKNHAL